ncbi:MAG: SNF2 family helicase [Flavobacteriaceae bacterium]|nr:SNF2 family helicase [Flavobacteriaceae bacterium]
MNSNLLKQYISEEASISSINRATSYYPLLVERSEKVFVFHALGSQIEPYQIRIDLTYSHAIRTSCSCPYNFGDICKHIVASIQELIHLINTKQIELDFHEPPKTLDQTALFLPHKNGMMDRDYLRKIQFDNSRGFMGKASVTHISKTKIEGEYKETYGETFLLQFSKESDEENLKLTCTCLQQSNCIHKYKFLSLLKEDFSLDILSPTFKDSIQQEILEEMGLQGKVDFDDVFELIVTTDGIFTNEKVNTLISDAQHIFQPANQDLLKEQALPSTRRQATHSLGLCFEHSKEEFLNIYPLIGKLNKKRTDLSAKIQFIDPSYLGDVLGLIEDQEVSQLKFLVDLKNASDSTVYNSDLGNYFLRFVKLVYENRNEFQKLRLYTYLNRKNLNRKNIEIIECSDEKVQPILTIKSSEKFHSLSVKIRIENKLLQLNSKQILIVPFGIIYQQKLYFYKHEQQALALNKFKETPHFTLLNEGLQRLQEQVIDPYSPYFEIHYSQLKQKKSASKKLQPIPQVYMSEAEEGSYLVFQPLVKYGEQLVEPLSSEQVWLKKDKMLSLKRDEDLEFNFLQFMQNLHPDFKDKTSYFFINAEEALKDLWVMNCIDQLQKNEIAVLGLNQLKKIKYNLNQPSFSVGLSSGTDWFDMEMNIDFGNQKVDLKKLQKSILKKSNYVELADGSLGILPKEWIEKYKKYFQLGQIKKNKIEISNFQFNIIDELYEDLENSPDFLKELHEKKKRIANLKDLKTIAHPKHLNASLRPYQQEGLNWMMFLHENKLGGCLADDMGLGKTLQTIAFLQHLKNTSKLKLQPHLIVAPTSLIFNWTAELKKFAPQLQSLAFTGAKRAQYQDQLENYDLILTTYGSLIKDIEFHKKQNYSYVILDESQAIKNPHSQRFKAVRLLQCLNRLTLTGTPIENNTFDLYSQFNFLNPGMFGSIKHFKTNFSEPIDQEQNQDTSNLLAKIIHPFMLRRTKAQVATELPSKTESIIYCEMNKRQRKVYDQFKDYFRQQINDQIENEGVNRSQMYILQGLTKLRQICNSTALADQEKDYGNDSAKLDELIRQLKEKVANHKVLVFSQFVGMLELVKERLFQEGINFEYLDGQTRKRNEKVENFQTNPEVRVFLISLKAGGTGLNLTEADYVFLIDPWWNPAVESQAIDRCYRIGQDKKVMAYRMICKDSIEEKIISLQDKKKTVASDVIRIDQDKKSFNKKDIEHFFGAV